MATYTVTDDILHSDAAAAYFDRADRRIKSGMRATLKMLAIPLPEYARPKAPGQSPAKQVMLAYAADNPAPRPMTLAPRKVNTTAERIAALRGQNTGKPCEATPAGLFDQAFPATGFSLRPKLNASARPSIKPAPMLLCCVG
jgi:hypothetical protein